MVRCRRRSEGNRLVPRT